LSVAMKMSPLVAIRKSPPCTADRFVAVFEDPER
jgi:hypothetical protein